MSTPAPNYPPLRPSSEWPFKKYRGKTTDWVIGKDPQYVRWCIDNTELQLDNEAYKALAWAEEHFVGDDVALPSERYYR